MRQYRGEAFIVKRNGNVGKVFTQFSEKPEPVFGFQKEAHWFEWGVLQQNVLLVLCQHIVSNT